jgi:hypothetical protein
MKRTMSVKIPSICISAMMQYIYHGDDDKPEMFNGRIISWDDPEIMASKWNQPNTVTPEPEESEWVRRMVSSARGTLFIC